MNENKREYKEVPEEGEVQKNVELRGEWGLDGDNGKHEGDEVK